MEKQPIPEFRAWYEERYSCPYPARDEEPAMRVRDRLVEAAADYLNLIAERGPPEDAGSCLDLGQAIVGRWRAIREPPPPPKKRWFGLF